MTNSVGLKIKTALKQREKTQNWLADQIGVSNYAVTKWIQGGSVSVENILKLAQVLDMPVADFIEGGQQLPHYHPDPKINAMMKVMESLPEYKKDLLIKMCAAFGEPDTTENNAKK